ncbi:MAG: RluA family pseudouridine synthase [Sphaerochaetaceae bacterium]|nr:RluA family pseudouridine synthase [Sphaerochaetaceae bacterium]
MRVERTYCFTADNVEGKVRADVFLSERIEGLSRSALTGELCEIFINGKAAVKSDAVRCGDCVTLVYVADVFEKVEPQDIPLDVIYEDESMLVINKTQGMVVHPGAGNPDNTVVNAIAFRYGQSFLDGMADECDVTRPGIVHRLDKDTSGVMVIAKTASAHSNLAGQFQARETKKYYYAFCEGIFGVSSGEIECLLARDINNRKLFTVSSTSGKASRSSYSVQHQYSCAALVKVRIFTGRTHQIRVHMRSIGHPVIGDVLYNPNHGKFADFSLMLHSFSLELRHPVTGEMMKFEAPLPERFGALSDKLTGDLR